MSKLFSFKIAIFDLDDTLWNGKKLFDDTKLILSTLKNSGVKMYIASYHMDAIVCCKHLGIESYFEDILYGRNKTKLDMINYIISKNPSVEQAEMVFFDDNKINIKDIKANTNVHVIHIGDTGIKWETVANGRIASIPMIDENYNVNKGYIINPKNVVPTNIVPTNIVPTNIDKGLDLNIFTDDFHLSDMAQFSRMWMKTITI